MYLVLIEDCIRMGERFVARASVALSYRFFTSGFRIKCLMQCLNCGGKKGCLFTAPFHLLSGGTSLLLTSITGHVRIESLSSYLRFSSSNSERLTILVGMCGSYYSTIGTHLCSKVEGNQGIYVSKHLTPIDT